MQEYKTYEIENFGYQYGNLAPSIHPGLERQKMEEERLRKKQERERRLRKKRLIEHKKELRRRKMHALYMTFGLMIFGGLCTSYIYLQNSITTSMHNIASLQSEISDLKAANAATESRIHTATNLNDIKNRAVNELGMVYATSDQIVYYDMQDEDYMNQYDNIP
ncbi:MAG: hypothetical protein K6G04_08060 [Lachnospiraceae bacterium]|nr:hypothetical protein [Lachnospiraceae bacterium]